MSDKNKEPKTIEHKPTPYNWYITDNFDALAALIVVGLAVYFREDFRTFADWLVGNI